MRGSPSLQDLLEVQQHFRLPSPVLVEKDWYVVRALAAINSIDAKPFRLVFSGGTALSRAHRLIRRMSEDIDLKIVSDEPCSRPQLRTLREIVTQALLDAGFEFDPADPAYRESGNASRYTVYHLPYEPKAAHDGALRPEIKVETAVWPLRLPPVNCSVTSFLGEAFRRPPEIPSIQCVALVETVAEKFVALTRRLGTELSVANGPRDETLSRHVYDLHVIRSHYDPSELIALARVIMLADAAAYGHQFPAYRENPVAETIRAVRGLPTDAYFAQSYGTFLRDLVYGETPDFETALTTLSALTDILSV